MEGPAMSDRSSETPLTRNLILDALGTYERAMLLADAETRPIKVGTTLFRPGDAIGYVAFPTSGTLSLIAQPDRAMPVEAATIGREGIATPHAPLGSRISTQELVGQIDGEMVTVGIERFVEHVRAGQFRSLVYGYLEALGRADLAERGLQRGPPPHPALRPVAAADP
jgi:hypothetical protein